MREMVLNRASLAAGDARAATGFLKGVAVGMSRLVRENVTGYSLRMDRHFHEIECAPGVSMQDAMHKLKGAGARDEFGFLIRLATKAPLLDGVAREAEHKFLTCEATSFPPEDGPPLLLCALTGGVAVGFPTADRWDRDRLTVEFEELLPNDTFSRESEDIDHLARLEHAAGISSRHRETLRAGLTPRKLWSNRRAAFPNLSFGPDVERYIAELPHFYTVVGRLIELDSAAGNWRGDGGAAPPWTCHVTNESATTRNDPKLSEARRFRSNSGERRDFFWHARCGSGLRIHLRFDRERYEVEIGYIGPHLPL